MELNAQKQTFEMLTVAYGEYTLSQKNVYKRCKIFKEGREDVNDDSAAYQLPIQMLKIVMKNCRIIA